MVPESGDTKRHIPIWCLLGGGRGLPGWAPIAVDGFPTFLHRSTVIPVGQATIDTLLHIASRYEERVLTHVKASQYVH